VLRAPGKSLLDLAVRHEPAHALCSEENERQADRFVRLLEESNRSHPRERRGEIKVQFLPFIVRASPTVVGRTRSGAAGWKLSRLGQL